MKRLTQKMKQINENKSDSSISLEEADNINRQAVAEESDGYYQRAFELYLKAAKAGSVWAMRNLGFVYKNIKNDDRSAFEWFKKAAEHADINLEAATDAMFELGVYYYRGEIIPKDVVKSFSWCKKAAENGVVNAMNWVGSFYRKGEGVIQNDNKAIEWFGKSANGGNAYAMLNLAVLYDEDGYKSEAYEWYEKAANAGNEYAKEKIAKTYKKGQIKSASAYNVRENQFNKEIKNKLFYIIADQLGIEADEIRLDNTFVDDLWADSLDIAELIMRIEDEFGIEIPDEEAVKIRTVEDAIKYIQYR